MIFWGFIISACLIYIFLAGYIIRGWVRTKDFIYQDGNNQIYVSVIIPVRDGYRDLIHLLSDLSRQNYPGDKFEVIIVDDHSADPNYSTSLDYNGKLKIRRLYLDSDEQGKKAALIKGLNACESELILTTDADCRVGPYWISELSSFYITKKVKLVFGTVLYSGSNKLHEWFQGLEYLSLIAAGAGFAGNGHPIICSAACMGFERTSYLEFIRETNSMFSVSGDDVLFLLWLKKKYPGMTGFIKSQNSIAETKPSGSLKEFINQRLRWTSKSRYYRDTGVILAALVVYFVSLTLLVLLAGSFFNGLFLKGFIILFLCKCISDFMVLYSVTGYYGNRYLLKVFMPLEIIYFVYISIIGLAGNLLPFGWKGRRSVP